MEIRTRYKDHERGAPLLFPQLEIQNPPCTLKPCLLLTLLPGPDTHFLSLLVSQEKEYTLSFFFNIMPGLMTWTHILSQRTSLIPVNVYASLKKKITLKFQQIDACVGCYSLGRNGASPPLGASSDSWPACCNSTLCHFLSLLPIQWSVLRKQNQKTTPLPSASPGNNRTQVIPFIGGFDSQGNRDKAAGTGLAPTAGWEIATDCLGELRSRDRQWKG